jgi:hypothetical protein
MTQPTRHEILARLRELSELLPDMRFGQMIANLSYLALGPAPESVWDVEDSDLLAAIRQQIETLEYRRDSVTPSAGPGR